MQHCDARCGWCARNWWRWLKSREAQMSLLRPGQTTSFAQAAATSIRPNP